MKHLVHRLRTTTTRTRSHDNRPWRSTDLHVLDLETTGLDTRRDHILSYGCIPIRAGRIVAADALYGLVRIDGPIPGESVRIHGIRTQDLADAPPLAACIATLHTQLGDNPVVAHCAWIERGFLRRAFTANGQRFRNPVLDTAALARHCIDLPLADHETVSLEYAAETLGLPVHTPHHALGDAMTTAGLFLALATRLDREHGHELTIAELDNLTDRPRAVPPRQRTVRDDGVR